VKAFGEKRNAALSGTGATRIAESAQPGEGLEGRATLARVGGNRFLADPLLHQEVFGPWSLVVSCSDIREMTEVVDAMEGQLTATVMATEEDMRIHPDIIEKAKQKCGRFIYNGVPTGVEVCLSMHHGGPFPATTDSRFTSVGANAIKRFARPLSFQNWPEGLLPLELRNANPLGIWRTVNNNLTRDPV